MQVISNRHAIKTRFSYSKREFNIQGKLIPKCKNAEFSIVDMHTESNPLLAMAEMMPAESFLEGRVPVLLKC